MNPDLLKKFDKHALLFREQDPGDEMYIIHSGGVRLLKQIDNKFELLAKLTRGDFFGEMSLIEPGTPRNATAITDEDGTTLILVNKGQFEAMLQSNLEITLKMIRQYAKRLQESNLKLEKLMRDQHELDSGIQDILSQVRKKSEPEEDQRFLFGWLQGVEQEYKFSLKRPEVLIGRKDDITKFSPDIDLTPIDPNRTVSRKHARISCYDDGVYLFEESGVINGTLINGTQITKGKIARLEHQDKVQLGKVNCVFLLPLKTVGATSGMSGF